MVMAVVLETVVVETTKVALEFPEATATLTGTPATEELPLESKTTDPPAGAGSGKVTVPVELFPPITDVGFSAILARDAAAG